MGDQKIRVGRGEGGKNKPENGKGEKKEKKTQKKATRRF